MKVASSAEFLSSLSFFPKLNSGKIFPQHFFYRWVEESRYTKKNNMLHVPKLLWINGLIFFSEVIFPSWSMDIPTSDLQLLEGIWDIISMIDWKILTINIAIIETKSQFFLIRLDYLPSNAETLLNFLLLKSSREVL